MGAWQEPVVTNKKAANVRPPLFLISILNRAPRNVLSLQGVH